MGWSGTVSEPELVGRALALGGTKIGWTGPGYSVARPVAGVGDGHRGAVPPQRWLLVGQGPEEEPVPSPLERPGLRPPEGCSPHVDRPRLDAAMPRVHCLRFLWLSSSPFVQAALISASAMTSTQILRPTWPSGRPSAWGSCGGAHNRYQPTMGNRETSYLLALAARELHSRAGTGCGQGWTQVPGGPGEQRTAGQRGCAESSLSRCAVNRVMWTGGDSAHSGSAPALPTAQSGSGPLGPGFLV